MTNDQIYSTQKSKINLGKSIESNNRLHKTVHPMLHVLDLTITNTCEILPGRLVVNLNTVRRPQNETHQLKYRILLKVVFITITLTYNGYVKIR